MNHDATLEIFDTHRPFLTALAQRITHNWADAEDLVSHASVRAQRLDFSEIENPKAFLATMVTNIAINHVNSARVRREVTIAPEQIAYLGDDGGEDFDLGDALSNALDVVLSRLSQTERTVFLLREVFQFEYAEIAELLEQSEANCRQLLKRAREKLAATESRFRVETRQRELALERFLAASRDGLLDELLATVAPEVVLSRDPSDAGMPQPPPILGRQAALRHIGNYLAAHPSAAWTCYRVSDRYEVAMLRESNGVSSALICATNNGMIDRLDQITCPKRVHTLAHLFGHRIGE